jgi:hypothetical protein
MVAQPRFTVDHKKFDAATRELERVERRATVYAIRKAQNVLKTEVRRNLRGAPRWGHRGTSRIYSEPVNKGFGNKPRSGPPGRFSGALYKGIGSKRRINKVGKNYVGGVGIGGAVNNLKKGRLEADLPYFAPAYRTALPKMRSIYLDKWGEGLRKATRR